MHRGSFTDCQVNSDSQTLVCLYLKNSVYAKNKLVPLQFKPAYPTSSKHIASKGKTNARTLICQDKGRESVKRRYYTALTRYLSFQWYFSSP